MTNRPNRLRPTPARSRGRGLALRLAPALALPLLGWLLTDVNRATAQYSGTAPRYPTGANGGGFVVPQNNFSPAPAAAGGFSAASSGFPGSQSAPSATVAALPPGNTPSGATTPSIETEEASSEPWQMPAIVDRLMRGGPLMIPLAVCSLIVIALSMERMIALRRGRVIPRPFVRRFTECVEDGQLSYDEASELCEEFDCPVAEVFRAAVRRWGRPMLEIEQAVMDAGDRVGDSLKRFVRVFHAISNVAPLLGLLGTVIGMIDAFEMLGTESVERSDLLAAGISVALVTTAAGLTVAIPAYLAYMYFSSKSDRYLAEIDKLCTRVVESISAEALENSGSTRRKKKAA